MEPDAVTARDGMLVLVRHGQSADNAANLFSGWRDPPLTPVGVEEARAAGCILARRGLSFDIAFSSTLSRARRTLELMLAAMHQPNLPTVADDALNERSYGELSGLNKDEACATWGAEQVRRWRKSYDAVPPGGESLAMTAARMLPFWRREIDARVYAGERVLVVAHGNSLRSIIKHLDRLADDDVTGVHVATSEILIYRTADRDTLIKVAADEDRPADS